MALDTNYVVGININDYFVDKDTGLPLAGGTITFYHDNNRSVGKYAYMLSGSPPNYTYLQLPNPITLSSSGTVIIEDTNQAVYFYPYDDSMNLDLYYIVVRDADGNTQLIRQGWPNIAAQTSPVSSTSGETDNQIINGQFHNVLFNPDYGITYSWTGAITNEIFNIAPGWELIVSASGDGSIIAGQLPLAGNLNINTNPPYALTVLPSGANISSIRLRQTLYDNPNIWANNFLSGFMLIASLDGINHSIQMNYGTSVPDIPQTLLSGMTGTSGYKSIAGVIETGVGVNTDSAPNAFTYIDLVLPTVGYVAISSVQVLPLESNTTAQAYIQNSVNKDSSDLFYYYNPLLQSIPVPSISEGWDFKVNPAQWGSTYAATTGASNYLWDQTILWQSADNLILAQRDLAGRLEVTLSVTGQFALVQYISMQQMNVLLANGWSALINAYTDNADGAPGTISFYYTTDVSLPDLTAGTNKSLISTIDAYGKPSGFNGTWTELTNPQLVLNRFTIPYSLDNKTTSIALNGWEQPLFGISSTATFVAIVVGFASLPATNVYFDSIAVTPGKLAVPFAPVGYNNTLLQMQHYYERSIPPGAVYTDTAISTIIAQQFCLNGAGQQAQVQPFSITYSLKRAIPSVTLYTAPANSGLANSVTYVDQTGSSNIVVSTYYTNISIGLQQSHFIGYGDVHGIVGGLSQNPIISFNFSSDARYGLF